MNIYYGAPKLTDALKQRYGIDIFDIANCNGGKALFDVIGAYNAVVEQHMRTCWGKTYDEILAELIPPKKP